MTKPPLGKVEALLYVLQHVTERGCATIMTHPLLRRSTPVDALKHLIGLQENAVNQALGGFKGFGRREPESYQAHKKTKTR